ncbi:MAG: hypothetical protein CR991_08910 [Proteobacteria bacterium]|nr:MAG: hypothetical protein CR991_08910 [Pseudomonadota bacterium]
MSQGFLLLSFKNSICLLIAGLATGKLAVQQGLGYPACFRALDALLLMKQVILGIDHHWR